MLLSARPKAETRVTLADPDGPAYSVWVTTADTGDAVEVRFARAYPIAPAAGWMVAGRNGLALRVASVAAGVMTCDRAEPATGPEPPKESP